MAKTTSEQSVQRNEFTEQMHTKEEWQNRNRME